MWNKIKKFVYDERGITSVEIILILVEIYIFYLYVFNVYTVI